MERVEEHIHIGRGSGAGRAAEHHLIKAVADPQKPLADHPGLRDVDDDLATLGAALLDGFLAAPSRQ
jgi:hypothetical protein